MGSAGAVAAQVSVSVGEVADADRARVTASSVSGATSGRRSGGVSGGNHDADGVAVSAVG